MSKALSCGWWDWFRGGEEVVDRLTLAGRSILDILGAERDLHLALYKQMVFVRTLEQALEDLSNTGEVSDLHLNRGQEAIATGVMAVLRPTDYIVVHHRTIAHAVAKGIPLYPLVAELLGKEDGVCGGMSGEMHLSYPPVRFMFSFQLVATAIPIAAGVAWASKYVKKSDDMAVAFHGDAATGNGQWHEGLNIAAVNRVPLLLVCENNHLAGNVKPEFYQSVSSPAERCKGYGIESAIVDGTHIEEVVRVAKDAVDYVRSESRPFLLECDVERLCWHKLGQRDSRTPEQLAEAAKRCPIRYAADGLLRLSENEKNRIFEQSAALATQVIARARAASPPVAGRNG